MNDKELADKVVALGADQCGHEYRWIEADVIDTLLEDDFVRDWRVAGALMEKWSLEFNEMNFFMPIRNPVQARDIIEECVRVLSEPA